MSKMNLNLSSQRLKRSKKAFILLLMHICCSCDDELATSSLLDQSLSQDQELDMNLSVVTDAELEPEIESESCVGINTVSTCLSMGGQQRNWQREWQMIPSAQMVWKAPKSLEPIRTHNEGLYDQIIPYSILPNETQNSQDEIQLTTLEVMVSKQTSSVELVIEGLKADRIFQEGYQSWSFASAITIPNEHSRDELGHLFIKEALTGDPLHGEHGVSFNLIAGQVGTQAETGVWLLAHIDPTYTLAAFGAEKSGEAENSIRLTARIGFEDIPLHNDVVGNEGGNNPNHTMIKQELVLITAPTLWLALKAYQKQVELKLSALSDREVRTEYSQSSPKRPPRGWYSWNERFEDIDAPYILEHIHLVDEKLKPFGFDLVEIDDGWQKGWGDWTSNDSFPDDFELIASLASELDLKLGLWFAPFLVDVEVATEKQYPLDWFVFSSHETAPREKSDLKKKVDQNDHANQVLIHRIVGNPRSYYVIDVTHPEAMRHVLEQLAYRKAQGFEYFKLDFLYAAALPGKRLEVISGIESLRKGLAAIRNAIGSEAFINACGAPVHAVLGYADSLRIGADTTFGELYPSFIASAARSTAARAYLYPLVWPDGDQVQTRSPYSIDEAQVGSDVAALSSAAYSIGDDLSILPDERLDIFTHEDRLWWAELPHPAIPLALMNTPAPVWLGNPLLDQLQHNGTTGALPPQSFIGQDQNGDIRRLVFDWDSPFTSNQEIIEGTGIGENN